MSKKSEKPVGAESKKPVDVGSEKSIDAESRQAYIKGSHRRSGEGGSTSGGDAKQGESTYKQILDAMSSQSSVSALDFSLLNQLQNILANNPELLGKVRNLNEFLAALQDKEANVVGLDGKTLTDAQKAKLAKGARQLRFDRKDIQHKRPPPIPKPF